MFLLDLPPCQAYYFPVEMQGEEDEERNRKI
jgi:hypothetical protein